MSTIWISVSITLIVTAALLPDDAAIALDLLEVWVRTAAVWLRSRWMMAGLWLRLRWDGSWLAWRLWVIRQRARHNRNNTEAGDE